MLQALNNIFMKILTWLPFDPCGPSVPMIPWQSSHRQNGSKFKFNIEWKVKLKQQIANYLYVHCHNSMDADKNNANQHDLLVDQVDQVAPLAQQAPEHPKDKT